MNQIPKSWQKGFDAAKAASLHSNSIQKSKQIGAALYSGNRLLSIGYNLFFKTHPQYKIKKKGETVHKNTHAEWMALLKRQYYEDTNLILYVYRESAKGNPACSRPCEVCESMLQLAGVSRVRFIDEEGNFKEEKK